jgi:hypothetical protein
VLDYFDNGSVLANTARLLLAMTMFFTYPMECSVARHASMFNNFKLIYGDDLDLNRRQTVTLSILILFIDALENGNR